MRAFLVAFEVEPVVMGRVYETLPLHCTLMHWFRTKLDHHAIKHVVGLVCYTNGPLFLHAGGIENFGPQKTIPVSVIRETRDLMALHTKIHQVLLDLSVTFVEPQYVGEGYRPHVTVTDGRFFPVRDSMRVLNGYVVQALNASELKEKKIVASFRMT